MISSKDIARAERIKILRRSVFKKLVSVAIISGLFEFEENDFFESC